MCSLPSAFGSWAILYGSPALKGGKLVTEYFHVVTRPVELEAGAGEGIGHED